MTLAQKNQVKANLDISNGLSSNAITALINCFKHLYWLDGDSHYLANLEDALLETADEIDKLVVEFSNMLRQNYSVLSGGSIQTFTGWGTYEISNADEYDYIKYDDFGTYNNSNDVYIYALSYYDSNGLFIEGLGMNEADKYTYVGYSTKDALASGIVEIPSNTKTIKVSYLYGYKDNSTSEPEDYPPSAILYKNAAVNVINFVDFPYTEKKSITLGGNVNGYTGWGVYEAINVIGYEYIKYSNLGAYNYNGIYIYGLSFFNANGDFISGVGTSEAYKAEHMIPDNTTGVMGYLIKGIVQIPSMSKAVVVSYAYGVQSNGLHSFVPNLIIL